MTPARTSRNAFSPRTPSTDTYAMERSGARQQPRAPLTPSPAPTESSRLADSHAGRNAALTNNARLLGRSLAASLRATQTAAQPDPPLKDLVKASLAGPDGPTAATPFKLTMSGARASALEINGFCQQAAYILAREIQNRPLSKEQRALMWRANEVRTEVIKALPLGRSNVTADFDNCAAQVRKNQSMGAAQGTYRALAARHLKWLVPKGSSTNHIAAGLAAVAGSGSCGDHANVAMHLFARDLGPGERLIKQRSEELDHAWIRIEGAPTVPGQPDSRPSVVLDAWADGPVIDPDDGTFTSSPLVSNVYTIEAKDGPSAYESFMFHRSAKYEKPIAEMAVKVEADKHAKHQKQADRKESHPLSDVVVWEPTPVLEKKFLRKLKRAALYGQTEGTLKDAALRVASESPSWAKFKDTKHLAAKIVLATKALGKPEDRFLLAFPPVSLGLIDQWDASTETPPPDPEHYVPEKIKATSSY